MLIVILKFSIEHKAGLFKSDYRSKMNRGIPADSRSKAKVFSLRCG